MGQKAGGDTQGAAGPKGPGDQGHEGTVQGRPRSHHVGGNKDGSKDRSQGLEIASQLREHWGRAGAG